MDSVNRNESELKKPVVRFHLTTDRIADVDMGVLLDLQDDYDAKKTNFRTLSDFMMRFIADENGRYLPEDEARAAVRKVSLRQLMEAFERISAEMQEVAAPNG